MTAGYSATPLARKLSLKDGMRVWWEGMPDDVASEILSDDLQIDRLERPAPPLEAVIREVSLPLGLVDVKVCAVDATWSALKLMIRRERR